MTINKSTTYIYLSIVFFLMDKEFLMNIKTKKSTEKIGKALLFSIPLSSSDNQPLARFLIGLKRSFERAEYKK